MKNSMLIFLTALLIYNCGCGPADSRMPPKKIHYILLVDAIDAKIVQIFKDRLTKGVRSLKKEQPENIDLISFTILLPTPNCDQISTSFSEEHAFDRNFRDPAANNFIDTLESFSHISYDDRFILKSIKRLLTEINDSTTDYKILLLSNMIEHSGITTDGNGSEDWARGKFHFTDNQNSCVTASLNAASDQLDDSTKWIYKNLILASKSNPLLRKIKIIWPSRSINVNRTGNGCDGEAIEAFWDKLFEKMDIPNERKTLELDNFLRSE